MNKTFFKTGLNEFIPCKVIETRDDDSKRIRLLADSTKGQYKAGESVHTMSQYVLTLDLSLIQRIAVKTLYPFPVTESNVIEIIKTLASHYSYTLAAYLAKMEVKAVNTYDSHNDTNDKYYWSVIHKIESIMAVLDITLDLGVGLYPAFYVMRDDKVYNEYSIEGALKEYNNFWNHS